MKNLLILTAALISVVGFAANTQTEESPDVGRPARSVGASSTEATAAQPSESGPILVLDMRPTYDVYDHRQRTENEIVAGYQVNKDLSVSAVQDFWTNIYDGMSSADPKYKDRIDGNPSGLGLVAHDLYAKVAVNNILKSSDGTTYLNYAGRLYAPTWAFYRDRSVLTIMRNYFMLNHDFNSHLSFMVAEVPILFLNSSAGGTLPDGTTYAAYNYWNKFVVQPTITFGPVSLALPIILDQIHKSNYSPKASGNNAWASYLTIYPELDYAVTKNLTLGVAYYSDSFIKNDISQFTIADGLNGTTDGFCGWQAVLRASL